MAAHDDRDGGGAERAGGDALVRAARTPDIVADAAYLIFSKPALEFTGRS